MGGFGTDWRRAVDAYESADPEDITMTAAILTATSMSRVVVAQVSDDEREMTIYALRTGNKSNRLANVITDMFDKLSMLTSNDVVKDTFLYSLFGALQGMDDEQRNAFSLSHALQLALDRAGADNGTETTEQAPFVDATAPESRATP